MNIETELFLSLDTKRSKMTRLEGEHSDFKTEMKLIYDHVLANMNVVENKSNMVYIDYENDGVSSFFDGKIKTVHRYVIVSDRNLMNNVWTGIVIDVKNDVVEHTQVIDKLKLTREFNTIINK